MFLLFLIWRKCIDLIFLISLTGQEEQIGGFDLIFKSSPIKLPSNSQYQSLLGSQNNRTLQLKKLAKSTVLRLSTRPPRSQSPNEKADPRKSDSKVSKSKKDTSNRSETTKTKDSTPGIPPRKRSSLKKPQVNSSALAEKVVKNVVNGMKKGNEEEVKLNSKPPIRKGRIASNNKSNAEE